MTNAERGSIETVEREIEWTRASIAIHERALVAYSKGGAEAWRSGAPLRAKRYAAKLAALRCELAFEEAKLAALSADPSLSAHDAALLAHAATAYRSAAGFVASRPCVHGGWIVIYRNDPSFGRLAGEGRWLVMHEPTSRFVSINSWRLAVQIMFETASGERDIAGIMPQADDADSVPAGTAL